MEEAEDLDLEDDLERLDLELLEFAEELRDFDLDLSESEPELLESCLIRPMLTLAADILKIGHQNEFYHLVQRLNISSFTIEQPCLCECRCVAQDGSCCSSLELHCLAPAWNVWPGLSGADCL